MAGDAKHSPEPWRLIEGPFAVGPNTTYTKRRVEGADKWAVYAETDFGALTASGADLRRIVACVNALAGVPTEALEAGKLGHLFAVAAALIKSLDTESGLRCDTVTNTASLYLALRALGRLP